MAIVSLARYATEAAASFASTVIRRLLAMSVPFCLGSSELPEIVRNARGPHPIPAQRLSVDGALATARRHEDSVLNRRATRAPSSVRLPERTPLVPRAGRRRRTSAFRSASVHFRRWRSAAFQLRL